MSVKENLDPVYDLNR